MNKVEMAIHDAIIDPELYAPTMLPYETKHQWQTRAVIYALRSIGLLRRPRAIQRHIVSAVMRCPVCSPRSWIRDRKQMDTNLVDVHVHWGCPR